MSSLKRSDPRLAKRKLLKPINLIRPPKPGEIAFVPISLERPSMTLLQIYKKIVLGNTRFIERTLQHYFPDRWDIKISESYAADTMFTGEEKKYEKYTNAEKEKVVRKWMSSTQYETAPTMHSVMLRENYMTIVIHFPELTVTNMYSRSHTIYDLYVRFRFSPLFTSMGGENLFYGLRTSMYYAEIGSNYTFSHLSANYTESMAGQWTQFCLGSTDFSILCNDMRTVFDKDRFEFLCVQLPDYLSWESIEGRPYRYIKDICERSVFGNLSSSDISGSALTNIVGNILSNEPNIPTRLAKGGTVHSIVIKEGDEFSDMVTRNINDINYLDVWDPVTKRANPIARNNKAEEIKRLREKAESKGTLFTFRGRNIKFKVLDESVDPAPVKGPFMVKSNVLRSVVKNFNNKFAEIIGNEYTKQFR